MVATANTIEATVNQFTGSRTEPPQFTRGYGLAFGKAGLKAAIGRPALIGEYPVHKRKLQEHLQKIVQVARAHPDERERPAVRRLMLACNQTASPNVSVQI